MEVSQTIAFVTFAAVATGTPGPSNVLLAAAGAKGGMRQGMPSLLGQVIGMSALLLAVTLGIGGLLLDRPWLLESLKWGGVVLLCWMAWGIATATSMEGDADTPVWSGFLGMAAFQWANPKGWLICVAANATFLNQDSGILSRSLTLTVLFMLTALPCCLPWLAVGAALQRTLRTPRTWLVYRCAMAGLLVASAALFVWPHD
ncbi:LysE family translocator [Actinomadura welshii]|uniref:LysE family translocator n=1 Tax=Actinomadura welshii TaxID=3103817 RepID=UPI0003AD30AB|nr:LysE family translocator [Actinomadura madurae]